MDYARILHPADAEATCLPSAVVAETWSNVWPEMWTCVAAPVTAAGADDAARSKAAGRLIPSTEPRTIADGLLTSLGAYTWPVVRDLVEEVVVVDDDAIRQAMRLVYERVKLVIEPSAAVSLAAVLSGAVPGARVGVVLSGGNLDLDPLFV